MRHSFALPRISALFPAMGALALAGATRCRNRRRAIPLRRPPASSPPSQGQCLADLGAREAASPPARPILRRRLLHHQRGASDRAHLDSARWRSPILARHLPAGQHFAGWARFGVDRAARQILGSPLVRIETMGSYSCRNVAGTDHRSAHATGNAIDVAAFVLADGRRISVLGGWNAARRGTRFPARDANQRLPPLWHGAGAGLQPAHRNHFHVEISNSAFCR
jgi:hypothetical protein